VKACELRVQCLRPLGHLIFVKFSKIKVSNWHTFFQSSRSADWSKWQHLMFSSFKTPDCYPYASPVCRSRDFALSKWRRLCGISALGPIFQFPATLQIPTWNVWRGWKQTQGVQSVPDSYQAVSSVLCILSQVIGQRLCYFTVHRSYFKSKCFPEMVTIVLAFETRYCLLSTPSSWMSKLICIICYWLKSDFSGKQLPLECLLSACDLIQQ